MFAGLSGGVGRGEYNLGPCRSMMIGSGWCENPDRVRAPGDGKVNIYGRKRILHRVNDTNLKPEENATQ